MGTTAVVIPTFNRRPILVSGLARLFENLPTTHIVIVVDSGSSDGTAEAVRKLYPQVILVEGDNSLWWAAATNRGIQKARHLGCDYVLTYNDDNVATANLFSNLAVAAAEAPGSIIAAMCCYLDNPEIVFFSGRVLAKNSDRFFYLDHDTPLALLEKGRRRVDMLHGMCTLFPMRVFDRVGFFNETEFPQVFADDDLLMRASKAGFPLEVALDAVVLNDKTKTGLNPYDRRLGLWGVLQLLISRRSTFQLHARTRFLWRHRRNFFYFCKTFVFDYARLFVVLSARWLLPQSVFHELGIFWGRQQQQR